jgi:DNA-binding LacI/PurR family transcriptional regulator
MADRPARAPIMADVARLAGVSHQTVSRVLNNHPSVAPETRRNVEVAISQLGYRRNTAARALVTKKTHTLGVVSVDTAHYGPASTLVAIETAAREANYFVNFASLPHVDRANMRDAVDHLMSANVDGLIVIAPLAAAVEALTGMRTDVPLVRVAGDESSASSNSVVVDQAAGARMATRHLLSLGHESVVHLRGPHGWLEADARVRGWRGELEAAGLPVPETPVGDWSPASGYRAGRHLATMPELTAVFSANDQMALGLISALHEAGRSVPGDVSVVGFDDIPEAGYFLPPLTTIRQDFAEVGRRCIAMLMALIAGEQDTSISAVAPTLILRASTASSGPGPVTKAERQSSQARTILTTST